MGGSASTRRIAPRANQPPCLLEPVTAEVLVLKCVGRGELSGNSFKWK